MGKHRPSTLSIACCHGIARPRSLGAARASVGSCFLLRRTPGRSVVAADRGSAESPASRASDPKWSARPAPLAPLRQGRVCFGGVHSPPASSWGVAGLGIPPPQGPLQQCSRGECQSQSPTRAQAPSHNPRPHPPTLPSMGPPPPPPSQGDLSVPLRPHHRLRRTSTVPRSGEGQVAPAWSHGPPPS